MGMDDGIDLAGLIDGWEELRANQRAFLAAVIETAGNKKRASAAAGIDPSTYWRWQNEGLNAAVFNAALEVAEALAADALEDEARRRAVEGVRRYRFNQGTPLRHPELCECGHELREHDRPRAPTDEEREAKEALIESGETLDMTVRKCLACSCPDFIGAPYFEHEYSDKLLAQMLAAKKPDEYAKRVKVDGVLRNLNWDALPDHIVDRIAEGEDPRAVLAAAAEQGVKLLLPGGAEVGGPGAGGEGGGGAPDSSSQDDEG